MNFRVHRMVLGVFFALGLVFSFGVGAFATHDGSNSGITAAEVAADPSEANMMAFLAHINGYYNQQYGMHPDGSTAQSEAITIFGRKIREDGPYKHGEVYSMGINERRFVTNHAENPGLLGYELKEDASGDVADTLNTLIDGSAIGEQICDQYGEKWACAEKVETPSGNVTTIVGIHHQGDGPFTPPECGTEFELDTTAENVYDDPTEEKLKAYVKGIIGVAQQQIANATNAQLSEFREAGGNPLNLSPTSDTFDRVAFEKFNRGILEKIYEKIACFSRGELKHENIYAFVMGANPPFNVLVNGNNFDLNGTNLDLDDDELPGNDKSIVGLFSRALEGKTSAVVNYRWDDPAKDGDEVPDFFENGKVPGTSCKSSYIEVANINEKVQFAPEVLYIFGSGTYPGDDVCAGGDGGDDDDGCAIAGAGHTSQSALLNLFLTASVLFSVVFLRRRV